MKLFRRQTLDSSPQTPEKKIKFSARLKEFFKQADITPDYWDELEELLLTSDVGVLVTEKILSSVRHLKKLDEIKDALQKVMGEMLPSHRLDLSSKPHVIMVAGVNGAGKTTSIAKLAARLKKEGKSVLLVAADTFRAAAIEQLKVWGERLDIPVVAQKQDSDSAAVAFDGVSSALAKGYDVVILDTAGRLHTNKNLMEELVKVKRVTGKALNGAPHDILLVLDSIVGQNGLAQAQTFNDALGLTGLILAKMDGTAKGGVILAIGGELHLPVSFIGLGEGIEDLHPFRPTKFIEGMLG